MVKHSLETQKEPSSQKSNTPLPYSSIEECFELLTSNDQQITASIAIAKIHQLCKSKRKSITNIRKKAKEILKICRVCKSWNDRKSILTCEACDDHYHQKCYKDTKGLLAQNPFRCQLCLADPVSLKKCSACDQDIKKNEKIGTCSTCHYEYHSKCFKKGLQMCKRCVKLTSLLPSNNKKQEKPLNQLKINQMFQLIAAKNKNKANRLDHLVQSQSHEFLACKILSKPDTDLIEKYKKQLLKVIESKKMNYTEYLVDLDNLLENLSVESLDFGLTNMSKAEEKEYLLYKAQPIGPYIFTYSQGKGVDVVADMDIPAYTIVCEYIGEVMTLRKSIYLQKHQKNDSVMDLWYGKNSDQSLVIRPEKWTNIARFLNGVGKRKEDKNVCSIKICYRGKPMVLLVTSRKIKKGESLCYEYNGQNEAKYPTEYFV